MHNFTPFILLYHNTRGKSSLLSWFCDFWGWILMKKKPRQKPRRVGYNPRKCGSVKPTKQPEWLSSLPCPYFIIKNRTCQYKKKIDDLAKSCPFVTVVKATLPQGCGSENHLRDYYIQRKIKSQYLEKIFCVVGKRHIFFYFWI